MAPKAKATVVSGISLSHPDRQLWPGISKLQLAEYWQQIAPTALPGIVRRPLSILRCPDGIDGHERFFQKNGHNALPDAVREGLAIHQPFLAIDDLAGLVAMAQMSAIELHAWGANEANPTHPDRLVFDLDPGEGVRFSEVIRAAHDIRARLRQLKLESFCRTTGGKGLHVVVPLLPDADWEKAKAFTRALAELMTAEEPKRFVAHLKIADRDGKILIDWLRNGLGATAVASFSPRARPGATVATPIAWDEVTDQLDPATFSVLTVPVRLAAQKFDPWQDFDLLTQRLPTLPIAPTPSPVPKPASGRSKIVVASAPRKR